MFNRIIYCIVKALTSQEEILLGNPTGFGNPNVFHRSLSLAIDNKYQFSFEHKCNFKKNACLMNKEAEMYSTFQVINIYMAFMKVNNFHLCRPLRSRSRIYK